MPPTLRSSPAGTRTTRNSVKSAPVTPERTPTPGKPRYCTTCKRPRKGHPREGCPFADEESVQNDLPAGGVAAAMSALDITAGADDDDEAQATDEDVVATKEEKPRKTFTRMPGTLITPTPSFMFSESQASCKTEAQLVADEGSFSSSVPYLGLSQNSDVAEGSRRRSRTPGDAPPPPPAPCGLSRTLTLEERTSFTSSLSRLAKATVYVLPTPDVPAICGAAAKRGLITRTLPLDHADTLLVVGHTAAAVEVLVYQVEARMHALVPVAPKAKSGTLSSTAKAMVIGTVGAVAAWSVLAFS
ncbi:hypothetical protein R3P38DRAFT_2819276 [Favolaschia claudopus]|uniref:Uncharacterized protein n=1 Tax=Favolaschia claudopus TaxID=2862362 RepID=A0AAW0ED56_9AGAR